MAGDVSTCDYVHQDQCQDNLRRSPISPTLHDLLAEQGWYRTAGPIGTMDRSLIWPTLASVVLLLPSEARS